MDFIPQACAKDKATGNANLKLFNAAGVEAPSIVHGHPSEINKHKNDDNDDIIAIVDLPSPQILHAPHVVNDTEDKEDYDGNIANNNANAVNNNNNNNDDSADNNNDDNNDKDIIQDS
jgi:hypothetical protein